MFYIKLTDDKELQVTEREHIYRGENLNDKLIFLIPSNVGDLDTDASLVYLSYIRADGGADVILLDSMVEMYNETYFQYTLPITCKMTMYPGQVCFFLQIFSGDPINPQIVKTGECRLMVEDSRNMDEYFSDRFITALYQHDRRMEERFANVDDNISINAEAIENNANAIARNASSIESLGDRLEEQSVEIADNASAIAELRADLLLKADGLTYDLDSRTLQLTRDGLPIGNSVTIYDGDGVGIRAMLINESGDLVATYDNGISETLGHVVGADGKTYVAHVSDHKILSWTIEDAAGEIPDPVDLNPDDEWSNVDEEQNQSDYFWEKM